MTLSVRLLRTAAATTRLADTDTAERVAEESGLFLRTVRDLRRIHSHLASFAYPILHGDRGGGERPPRTAASAVSAPLTPKSTQPRG
jgi:phosphate:Na+ symporter